MWEGQAADTMLCSLQQIGSSVIIVSEGHGVVVQTGQAVWVDLKVRPLVVGKDHGEKGFRVADKLVHIPLASHLRNHKGEQMNPNLVTHEKAPCTHLSTLVLLYIFT